MDLMGFTPQKTKMTILPNSTKMNEFVHVSPIEKNGGSSIECSFSVGYVVGVWAQTSSTFTFIIFWLVDSIPGGNNAHQKKNNQNGFENWIYAKKSP